MLDHRASQDLRGSTMVMARVVWRPTTSLLSEANVLSRLFTELEEAPPAGFIMAAKKIAGRAEHMFSRLSRFDVPVVVVINATANPSVSSVKALQNVRDQHGEWRFSLNMLASLSESRVLEAAFLVESVEYNNTVRILEEEDIEAIESLISGHDRLVVSNVSFALELDDELTNHYGFSAPPVYGRVFERLFRSSGSPKEKLAVVEHVKLTHSLLRRPTLARLCTAMAVSRIAKAVTIPCSCEEDDLMEDWSWSQLAYALFSRYAHKHSSIRAAKLIDCHLTVSHVKAIANVLALDDPASLLYGDSSNIEYKSRQTAVKQGTRVTITPINPLGIIGAHSMHWTLPSDVSGAVRLGLDGISGRVRVLLPGYGLCLVDEDALFDEDSDENDLNGGVNSLTMEFNESPEAAAGFSRLVELIGSSLTHLDVTMHSQTILDICQIFKYCPNLQSLRIIGPAIRTREFIKAYREFKMKIKNFEVDFDDLLLLSVELVDRDSPFYENVKTLEFYGIGETSSSLDQYEHSMSWIVSMLYRNKKLERITLAVPSLLYDKFQAQMAELDGQVIAVTRNPFPLACRVAFLSVAYNIYNASVENKKRAKTQSYYQRKNVLPPEVLLTIFHFAAESKRRHVEFFTHRA